jgi:NAD(P)-dependent dehydrogenase (short-subunit alcohol dehydrogenase family)
MNLQSRVGIVTGAGSGIGRAVCMELVRGGASVVAVDLDADAARQTATEVEGIGGQAETVLGDVSDEETFVAAVELAERSFGRVDILVSCAIVEGPAEELCSYPLDEFDRVLAVNVRGTFLGLKHVLPRLVDQGSGAVVNFSSASEPEEDEGSVAYAASRQAVLGLTRAAARQAGPAGVRVNAIAMGPNRHSACPEEVAEVVRFLVSPWASANGAVWSLEAGQLVS